MPLFRWFLLSYGLTLLVTSVSRYEPPHTYQTAVLDSPHPPAPPPKSGKFSPPVVLTLTCAAYTPWDAIDDEYRSRHPIPRTASGTLVSEAPFGIAGPRHLLGHRVALRVPGFPPFDEYRVWTIDDTGGTIRRVYRDTGEITLELRFTDPEVARQFGRRSVSISFINNESGSLDLELSNPAE